MKKINSVFRKSLIVLFFLPLVVLGQDETGGGLEKFIDFLTIHPNKKAVKKDSSKYLTKLVLAPIISYSPETSVGFGTGAKFLFKLPGSGDETRTSNIPMSTLYTFKNQFLFHSGYAIFFKEEKWMLEGNLRFKRFPNLFWGVGNETPEDNEEEYNFTQIEIEPILLKELFVHHLFLGAGIRYNYRGNLETEEHGILAESIEHNGPISGANGSVAVGAELALVYDSRDNLVNSHTGVYVEFTHGFYDKVIGGTHKFQLSRLDVRAFIQPWKKVDDVIGFQLDTHFSHGDTPIGEQAELGSPDMMRGYFEGRYIDRNFIGFQTEYRKRIIGRLGGVLFAGLGDVSDKVANFNIKDIKPSIGTGIRLLLDKKEDLNVRFDWGAGRGTNNYYLNIAEAF